MAELSGPPQIYTPKRLRLEPAKDTDRVDGRPMWICSFYVPWPGELREFDVVVNYRQELIEGRFLYLPLFEDGAKRRSPEDFKFTAISISQKNLSLETKNEMILRNFGTRISLVPEHQRLIAMRPLIKQAGNGQAVTRPEPDSEGSDKPQPDSDATQAQQSGGIVEMDGSSDQSYRKHGGRKADLRVTIEFKTGDEPAFQVAVTNVTGQSLRLATRADVFAGLLFSNMGQSTELCLVDSKYLHMNFIELASHEPIPLEPNESITWTIPLKRLIVLETKRQERRPV